MQSHSALNAAVEAWIDHIIKAGGQTVIMPDGPDSLPTAELVVTPRQSKKRQRQASTDFRKDDLETTPRHLLSSTLSTSCLPVPFVPCCSSTDDRPYPGRDQTLSEVQSTSTADTNGTSRSGRSSPRKKEVALRRTLDWPIARVNITELKSVPTMLESLALDLKKISDGRQSLIPDIFRVRHRHFYSLSSVYSQGSSNGGANPPARSLPSSGYSPAANRPSSRGSSGPGPAPTTPAHADIMSAYGHSSYAASQSSGSGSVGGGGPARPSECRPTFQEWSREDLHSFQE